MNLDTDGMNKVLDLLDQQRALIERKSVLLDERQGMIDKLIKLAKDQNVMLGRMKQRSIESTKALHRATEIIQNLTDQLDSEGTVFNFFGDE